MGSWSKSPLQKELIETKNFLESIVEKAGDAISVVDLEGKGSILERGGGNGSMDTRRKRSWEMLSEFLYPRDEARRS